MNLLLDSCTLIWLTSEPALLSAAATAAIDHPAARLHVSHASLWEIALKHEAGKLHLPAPLRSWWAEQIHRWSLIELPLTGEVLLQGTELPRHHKDPFDRAILAQALSDNLALVSPDSNFPLYGVSLIW